jgi:hypothetical protein
MLRDVYACILIAALCLGQAVCAEAPDPDPGRFAETIETFAVWDSKNSFPEDAILFVGSSSVRLWPTAIAFPGTEFIFISIKPSKQRWANWPTMAEANRMVRKYAEGHPRLGYADLATPLLDKNGRPKDVFVEDGLHLNEQGYKLWQQALAPYLE